jgi:signal transduction histidine kinase
MDPSPNEARLGRLLAVLQKGLGHELPNQLVAVQGLARLLAQEEGERLSPEGRDYLGRAAAGAARAHALVEALAEVARLARPPAPGEAVDLAEAVREAVAEAKQLAPGPLPDYHSTVTALPLSAPRRALRTVLLVLLRHAGAAAARVELSTRPAAPGVDLRIAGDGPAVPAGQVERLFEPFAGPDGRGLDLFLAREIAVAWGGSLRWEPGERAGAGFVVTCPMFSRDPLGSAGQRPPEGRG